MCTIKNTLYLAAPLGFGPIGVDGWLLGIGISRLDALESWLPLCRRQAAEGIVDPDWAPKYFEIFACPRRQAARAGKAPAGLYHHLGALRL